jgi:Protein of unknown function (DUF2914)
MIRIYLVVFLFLTSYLGLASDKKKFENIKVKQFSLVKDEGGISDDGKEAAKSFKVLLLLEAEIPDEENLHLVWKRADSKYLEENIKIDKKNKKWFTKNNLNVGEWSIDLLDRDKKILKNISFSIDNNGKITIKNQKEDNIDNPKTLVQALESLQDKDKNS